MKKVVSMILAILICVGSWLLLALILIVFTITASGFTKEVISRGSTCVLVVLFWALLWNIESLYEWFLEKSGYYKTGG